MLLGLLIGCRSSPPFETFEAMSEPAKGPSIPTPPAGALRAWRVWINQEQPIQKKAPEWRSFGPKDAVLLDLAPDGRWRCLLNPVHVLGKINERAKIREWLASRAVRCSSDGWKTFVEGVVQAAFDPDGQETGTTPSAALYLNDAVGGVRRSTVVVLEGEKKLREASVD